MRRLVVRWRYRWAYRAAWALANQLFTLCDGRWVAWDGSLSYSSRVLAHMVHEAAVSAVER